MRKNFYFFFFLGAAHLSCNDPCLEEFPGLEFGIYQGIITEAEEQLNNATGSFQFDIQEEILLMIYEDEQENLWEVTYNRSY